MMCITVLNTFGASHAVIEVYFSHFSDIFYSRYFRFLLLFRYVLCIPCHDSCLFPCAFQTPYGQILSIVYIIVPTQFHSRFLHFFNSSRTHTRERLQLVEFKNATTIGLPTTRNRRLMGIYKIFDFLIIEVLMGLGDESLDETLDGSRSSDKKGKLYCYLDETLDGSRLYRTLA